MSSGQFSSDDIGKTVYLSNSTTSCQEWLVADVNHDNTEGTVDLVSRYIVNSIVTDFANNNTVYDYKALYANSYMRYYLNYTFLNGFTDDVKLCMAAMKTKSYLYYQSDNNRAITYDPVRLASWKELKSNSSDEKLDDESYPLFVNDDLRAGKDSNGASYEHLLRAYNYSNWYSAVCNNYVYEDGNYHGGGTDTTIGKYAIRPFIRFGCTSNTKAAISLINPVKALSSGKITKDYIGKVVYLRNSNMANQEWIIADVNHDGTNNTVDLVTRCIINFDRTSENTDVDRPFGDNAVYETSTIRSLLNSTIYNGFDNCVKNALKDLNVASNGKILHDKVKLLSLKELCLKPRSSATNFSGYVQEGNEYPLFGGSCIENTNPKSVFINPYTMTYDTNLGWKIRTRSKSNDTTNIIVTSDFSTPTSGMNQASHEPGVRLPGSRCG